MLQVTWKLRRPRGSAPDAWMAGARLCKSLVFVCLA